jgi:integrase
MRTVQEYATGAGERRYKVRFRLGGRQTSETFRRKADAEMFAGILGDGRDGRVLEAMKWLGAKREERDTHTFAEWHEIYVEQLTGITQRTRDDYRAYRRRYFGALDDVPLPLLTRGHVTALVNRLEREGKKPKTIANVIRHLSSCLGLAHEEGHLTANPCRRVRLPKDDLDAHEARFLTGEEFAALLAAIPEHYRPLVTFMVGTGLRWSEATAIQSRHVDLDRGTVRVAQAWKGTGKTRALGPPKSSKSRRTVNAATLALAAAAPLLGKPNDYVFTTPTGRVIAYSNFRDRIWLPAVEKAGIEPRPGLHALRHTFASWMISEGTPLEAVQDQLGHESIITTRKLYAHLLPAVGVAAGKAASAALARALGHGPQPLSVAVLRVEAGSGTDQPAHPRQHAPDLDDGRDG